MGTRTRTERCQRNKAMIRRKWRIEGNVHTAIGVWIDDYEVPHEDLHGLDHDRPDWWYQCSIQDLASVLGPWAGRL